MVGNDNSDVTEEQSGNATPPTKKATKKSAKRSTPRKKVKKPAKKKPASKGRKKRTVRPYPAVAFNQAIRLGTAIHEHAGDRVRRLTILEKLKMSQTSSGTSMMITNSGKYGITKGGYTAEWLELTPLGKIACDPTSAPRTKLEAQFELAIGGVVPFKLLFDEYAGKKIAAREVMFDLLDTAELGAIDNDECVDIFITNVKDLGLLRTIAGAETLIPLGQALDEAGTAPRATSVGKTSTGVATRVTDWDSTCFYVTPIGDEGTDIRKHSDLFKSSIVEPAMAELGLKVVRADDVETAGMITSSIIEYIKRSKLVIADLSMLNPNVFYEIALRHACRLPIVQIRRKGEVLPFDVGQVNTITIDDSDLYNFVPQMQTFKAEVANLARTAIENPEQISNPITAFYPAFWD
jgi:hypothetical protein